MTSEGDFPWLPGVQPFEGPFRDNVVEFLTRYGTPAAVQALQGASAWVVPLQSASGTVLLHVYEQRLDDDSNPACDNCRHTGEVPGCARKTPRLSNATAPPILLVMHVVLNILRNVI